MLADTKQTSHFGRTKHQMDKEFGGKNMQEMFASSDGEISQYSVYCHGEKTTFRPNHTGLTSDCVRQHTNDIESGSSDYFGGTSDEDDGEQRFSSLSFSNSLVGHKSDEESSSDLQAHGSIFTTEDAPSKRRLSWFQTVKMHLRDARSIGFRQFR
jgi:hypothetical protein